MQQSVRDEQAHLFFKRGTEFCSLRDSDIGSDDHIAQFVFFVLIDRLTFERNVIAFEREHIGGLIDATIGAIQLVDAFVRNEGDRNTGSLRELTGSEHERDELFKGKTGELVLAVVETQSDIHLTHHLYKRRLFASARAYAAMIFETSELRTTSRVWNSMKPISSIPSRT